VHCLMQRPPFMPQKKEVARIEKICNALAARENIPPWSRAASLTPSISIQTLLAAGNTLASGMHARRP
jgi:hypothetical protein